MSSPGLHTPILTHIPNKHPLFTHMYGHVCVNTNKTQTNQVWAEHTIPAHRRLAWIRETHFEINSQAGLYLTCSIVKWVLARHFRVFRLEVRFYVAELTLKLLIPPQSMSHQASKCSI